MSRTKDQSLQVVFLKAEKALSEIEDSRLIIKLLAIKGYATHEAKDIASIFQTQTRTIYKWVQQFSQGGIDGLRDKPKGHRQALLNEEQKQEIAKWLDSSKTPDGKDINWTLKSLCYYIKLSLGGEIKKSALANTLKKMNYGIRRPHPTHAKGSETERSDFKKLLIASNHLEKDKAQTIYFFDEARFGLQSSLCRKWAKRGSECTVKVKQSYQNFYIYSSVAPKTGDQFSLLLTFVNTEIMQLYLDEFSMSLGSENAILVMDQAGWHKSKDLIVPANLEICFLPPYSPELNPVERLWKYIKQNTIHNRIYENLKHLEKAVIDYFDLIDCQLLTKLYACSYI